MLKVPREAGDRKGKCRSCGTVFAIGALLAGEGPSVICEDSVANWLADDIIAEGGHKPAVGHLHRKPPPLSPQPARPAPAAAQPVRPSAREADKRFPVRLVQLDLGGATLAFDSQLLYDLEFRSSMPRRCLVCGYDKALTINLMMWNKMLEAPYRNKTPETGAPMQLDYFGDINDRDLLNMLERVKHMPEPFCLPMPFYICSLCSAHGAIATDVRALGESLECRIIITHLPQAEAFVRSACGADCAEVAQIRATRKSDRNEPWRNLPVTVRMRINQWFESAEQERFLMYVPDAEFSRNDSGLAGLVLTTRRLVFHKAGAQLESTPFGETTLQETPSGAAVRITLKFPQGSASMLAHERCVGRLKDLLGRLAAARAAAEAQLKH
jgi:hypothetical protein